MKHIENCIVMGDIDTSFSIINSQNKAHYQIDFRGNFVSYSDPFGNSIFNSPMKIRINFELFSLDNVGDVISCNDGTSTSFLETKDIQEIAQATFFDENQKSFFNFLTHQFTADL